MSGLVKLAHCVKLCHHSVSSSSPSVQLVRCLHTTLVQERMLNSRRGEMKYDDLKEWYDADYKKRWKLFKEDMKRFKETLKSWDFWDKRVFKKRFRDPTRRLFQFEEDDEFKFAEFKDEENLKKWKLGSDRIWNEGFSTCQLELNPGGFATFSGHLDSTTLPKDGDIAKVGYVNMTLFEAPDMIEDDGRFFFDGWTHLTMRIRGDGRKWLIVLCTRGDNNLTWDDKFCYWLHTTGGPYWQDVKIPFSKFFFGAHGRIQEPQFRLPGTMVSSVGLTLMDGRTGPFRLDVEYMGITVDTRNYEELAYEHYYVPEHRVGYLD